jgi:predicted phosphodiesterase
MRIQYMSDLHLEFQENSRYLRYNELPVTGDVLVLAGDIFYLKDKTAPVMNFWKWASKNYCQVLIVPGNHEYYNFSDVMERGFQWKWMLRENVGYYQNQVVRIDDMDFVLKYALVAGGTRVISNQMGYIFANEHLMNGFESGKFIEIK